MTRAVSRRTRASRPCALVLLACSLGCRTSGDHDLAGERALALPAGVEYVPLVPEARQWNIVDDGQSSTKLDLPNRWPFSFAGDWTRRDTLWNDASFVYATELFELRVVNGGTAGARTIWRGPERETVLRNPAWSPDGTTLYLWLSHDQPLSAVDARTGKVRVVAEVDTQIVAWSPWHFLRSLDPNPRARPDGVIIDDDRLIVLLGSDEGFWLADVNARGGQLHSLFDRPSEAGAWSWDLSLERGLLWTIEGAPSRGPMGERRKWIETRRLDGELVRIYSETEGEADTVQLSPDGRRLLVGRQYQPDAQRPVGDLDEFNREELRAQIEARDGGFLIMDLDSGAITDGPRRGSEARWAPDGNRIALVDEWTLHVCALRERTLTPLIDGVPEGRRWSWTDPVWSPDGNRLAITARAFNLTLLLDLPRREYFVLREEVTEMLWGPRPRLFEDAPGPGGVWR
jgi:hypothetical protein